MFDGLFQVDDNSFEKILVSLIADDENIAMKTDIQKPLALTKLEVLADWLELENLPDSAKLIRTFVKSYRINRVSNQRKSRQEVIHALTEGMKEDKSIGEKLIGKEKE